MRKKLCLWMVVAAALFVLMAACALAEPAIVSGPFAYEAIEDRPGELRILGIANNTRQIPASIVLEPIDVDGVPHKVTEIGPSAFSGQRIAALNGADVLKVGDFAFQFCTSISSVNLPVATQIGSKAFSGCSKLEKVSAPVAAKVGAGAFLECKALQEASFPALEALEMGVFSGCSSLLSADFPSAITIDGYLLGDCLALERVNIPLAQTLGDYAFFNCEAIRSVEAPSLTTVGNYAFFNCVSLESVTLPAVESVGNLAFRGCAALQDVYLTGDVLPQTWGKGAFLQAGNKADQPLTAWVLPHNLDAYEQIKSLGVGFEQVMIVE